MNAGITLKDLLMFGSIAGTILAGGLYMGRLDQRVSTLEGSKVTGERIATLETEVRNLAESTRELKGSINDLVRELRKN